MIYHIATIADWENCKNDDVYIPSRFAVDGFIHCSTETQIDRIANTIFSSYSIVWLLTINDTQEKAFITYENLEGGKERFPHIYRKLPKSSIERVLLLEKEENGNFLLPFINS